MGKRTNERKVNYEVMELDNQGTLKIVIECPVCYIPVEYLYVNIEDFEPIDY